MFTPASTDGYQAALPGITRKTLVHGERTLLAEFRLRAGHVLPRHSHPHEQSGYLVQGSLELTIGAEVFRVRPGDAWCIPGGVEHSAVVIEDAVAIEVFSPVRQDYLTAPSAGGAGQSA